MAKKNIKERLPLEKRMQFLEVKLEELRYIDLDELNARLNIIESKLYVFKEMLSAEEAARYLGLSMSKIYKMTCAGEIAFFKPYGKKMFFAKTDLDKYIKRGYHPVKQSTESETEEPEKEFE